MNDAATGGGWRQIAVTTAHSALAEALFEDFGAAAVSVIDADERATIEAAPGAQPGFTTARVSGLFAADAAVETITDALTRALGPGTAVDTETLTDQDWENAWRTRHPPLHFGGRLWAAPHGARVTAGAEAVIVRLDPGTAFGTGTHPTTALCMTWLAHADLSGCTVLDYGCGSGILAIAAARLGAARVTAVDIDGQAVRATRANAAANAVAATIETPALGELDAGGYDIVLANILARPLIELAPTLTGHTRPGGRLVLSGLLSRQVESVRSAYDAHFAFAQPAHQDDWIRLDGRRAHGELE